MITYLMLDKDDITKVCGTIAKVDFMNELHFNEYEARNFIDNSHCFRDRYILVEEEKENSGKVKFFKKTDTGKKYYVSENGKFYVVSKSGKRRELRGFIKKRHKQNVFYVKMQKKEYVCKNVVASLFIKKYRAGDTVKLRNGKDPKNVGVANLMVIDKATYAKTTGPMSRSRRVGFYENGKLISTYRSAREAGIKLYCSYQTVIDCCNEKYKTKLIDVRWI